MSAVHAAYRDRRGAGRRDDPLSGLRQVFVAHSYWLACRLGTFDGTTPACPPGGPDACTSSTSAHCPAECCAASADEAVI